MLSRAVEGARSARQIALAVAVLLLAGCVQIVPPGRAPAPRPTVRPTVPYVAPNAALLPLKRGPTAAGLGLRPGNASAALASFVTSCPRLTKRADTSGLTQPADWVPACTAARNWPSADAASFFDRWFETAELGDGQAFVTGYYEPEIAGVRTPQPGYSVPVYAKPPDLVRAMPGEAPPKPDGSLPLGRYDETGQFTLYYDRAAIEDGALAGQGLEIGWAADPVEFFFLQIQGSGRLVAPDGTVMRIGFAGQNGYEFTSIARVMRDRGLIGSGPGQYPGSMQGVMRFLRENPDEGRELMRLNRSYVFFREITGEGPVGALGVPVKGRTTLAADPAYTPLGAPVWLQVDRPEASGLWVAQDTGGAIKGANRFDSFWGAGADARRIAGGMSGRGRALILLPKGTLAKLGAQ